MGIKEDLTGLYIAYFGRAPDPVGFSFWFDALSDGFPLESAATIFVEQPETLSRFPFVSAPDTGDLRTFLDAVYQNLYSRDADDAGAAFWISVLEGGRDYGLVILDIIDGAVGADAALIDNMACPHWVVRFDC